MTKNSDESRRKDIFKIVGLIWILIETNLIGGKYDI